MIENLSKTDPINRLIYLINSNIQNYTMIEKNEEFKNIITSQIFEGFATTVKVKELCSM
jgi:hypothetical protein